MATFLAFMVVLMLLTGAIQITYHLRWLAHVKRVHPAAWEELGSPAVRPFSSIDEYRRRQAFIRAGGPQRTGDEEFCRLTRGAQVTGRLYLAIFAVVMVTAAGLFAGLWS